MPQRSPERPSPAPSRKPRSTPSQTKSPGKRRGRALLTLGALGGLVGGVVLGKRTWDSLSELQQMRIAKRIVDMKIPFLSAKVNAILQRRIAEHTKEAVKKFHTGMGEAFEFLGKKLGIIKKGASPRDQ